MEAAEYAAARYSEGVDRGLGILLRAICATRTGTFAAVFVPEDREDALYHLLGPLLRVSCPVERYSTTAIENPLHWRWLRWRYGKQRDFLEENQGVRP